MLRIVMQRKERANKEYMGKLDTMLEKVTKVV